MAQVLSMRIDLQHEGASGLAFETSDTPTTSVPTVVRQVRRASAHVQKNIAERPISTCNRAMERVQSRACGPVGRNAGKVAANYGLREGEACAGARAYL